MGTAPAGSGSSLGRRSTSGGGELRKSPCVMTGSCLKYRGGLRLPLSIPLTLTLTSLLPTSQLGQSSPISCSSCHHWAPTRCHAGLPRWVTTRFLLHWDAGAILAVFFKVQHDKQERNPTMYLKAPGPSGWSSCSSRE